MPTSDIHDDNCHGGHGVDMDNSTVATRALMTADGKCVQHPWVELRKKDLVSGQVYQLDACPECNEQYEANKEALRRRKVELERQLQALDNESLDATSRSGGSAKTSRSGESSTDREQAGGSSLSAFAPPTKDRNSSTNNGKNNSNNNTSTRESTSSESHSAHPQPYRPPFPLQQQQQQQQEPQQIPYAYPASPGRPMRDDDDDSIYSIPQRQQSSRPPVPAPYTGNHNGNPYIQKRNSAPPRSHSSTSVASNATASTTNFTNANGIALKSPVDTSANANANLNEYHSTTPYSNNYDRQFLAAAAAAFHQATISSVKSAPAVQQGQQEEYNSTMLWKLLQDKEDEVRHVRQTLQETQRQLQEQAVLATKLQTTLDQAHEAFKKERLLIKLQAEKDAQESLSSRQEEMFRKQVEWMESNIIQSKKNSSSNNIDNNNASGTNGNGGGIAGGSQIAGKETSRKAEPNSNANTNGARKIEASTPNSAKKKPEKAHPWTAVAKGSPGREKTSGDDEEKLNSNSSSNNENNSAFKIVLNANSKNNLYPSIDEAALGNAAADNSDAFGKGKDSAPNTLSSNPVNQHPQQQQNAPKTPLGLSTAETPMANNTSTANKAKNESSDRFDPVYVASSADVDKACFSPGSSSLNDDQSIGQTVASSTYGDDRVKVVNKKLLDPYGDKGTYTGVVLRNTGMPHGLGRMVYEEDRRVFEGDWRHGRWHGYGRASFSNGDSYEGEYKFDQRHGTGVYRWNDGRVYDGQFSEDKRHGKGVFTWPDGAVYDGDFVNGQRQGHGKYTFADGGQYEGSWKDGRYDGFGTCTWEDGRRYRGEWRNGMAHGRGTETYPNGNIRHEGEWIDDEPIC